MPATNETKEPAAKAPAKEVGTSVQIGRTVQYMAPGFGTKPRAGIVADVDAEGALTLWVLNPEYSTGAYVFGVRQGESPGCWRPIPRGKN